MMILSLKQNDPITVARHNTTGREGETIAAQWLQDHGVTVLARNWRYGKAEVDIIGERNHTLLFIEVKTRSGDNKGLPEEAVNKTKQAKLLEAAEAYIEQTDWSGEIRFDVVAVELSAGIAKVRHITDAFFPYQE